MPNKFYKKQFKDKINILYRGYTLGYFIQWSYSVAV